MHNCEAKPSCRLIVWLSTQLLEQKIINTCQESWKPRKDEKQCFKIVWIRHFSKCLHWDRAGVSQSDDAPDAIISSNIHTVFFWLAMHLLWNKILKTILGSSLLQDSTLHINFMEKMIWFMKRIFYKEHNGYNKEVKWIVKIFLPATANCRFTCQLISLSW